MKRIILLSSDNKLINSFMNYYKGSSFYSIELLKEIENIDLNKYDGIVMDYFMCNNGGYSVLEKINANIYIFIVFPNIRIEMDCVLNGFSINYIFYKPICMLYVERIMDLFFYNGINTYLTYRKELFKVFKELGLSFKHLGTKYLFFLLSLVLCEDIEINEELYVLANEKFHVEVPNIIKDISYTIDSCFDNPDNEEIKREIFGILRSKRTGAVTNLNFIYNVYIYIKYCISEKEFIKK